MTEFKKIEGFTNYSVSTDGQVRNDDTGRILKPADNGHGYPSVFLCKQGKGSTKRIHRLMAEAFIPNPENLASVDHIDGNKENNTIENLQWMSFEDNTIKSNAKTWKFVDPQGEVREIYNLTAFSRENGLDQSSMTKVNKGKAKSHKGWTKFIETEE